jgi:RNA polymerase sigma factor (TIGR02999 family)
MNNGTDGAEITRLLQEWQNGSHDAFEQVFPLVYAELRTIASRHLAREWRHDHLQTTAVVNEAYVRLFGQREVDWQNRGHFFAVAAQLMRRILVDHARHERRQKRGGGQAPVALDSAVIPAPDSMDAVDTLDLDRALSRLEQLDAGAAKIVELRFFGGLTIEETAAALGISPATVKREWAIAKGWLYRELAAGRAPDAP